MPKRENFKETLPGEPPIAASQPEAKPFEEIKNPTFSEGDDARLRSQIEGEIKNLKDKLFLLNTLEKPALDSIADLIKENIKVLDTLLQESSQGNVQETAQKLQQILQTLNNFSEKEAKGTDIMTLSSKFRKHIDELRTHLKAEESQPVPESPPAPSEGGPKR